jgi:hypothetical protein
MTRGAPNKVMDFIEEITIALGGIATTLKGERIVYREGHNHLSDDRESKREGIIHLSNDSWYMITRPVVQQNIRLPTPGF